MEKKNVDEINLYKKIANANKEIKTMGITRKNKSTGEVITNQYAPVNERIKAYRKVYPQGQILPSVVDINEKSCTIECTITDNDLRVIAIAHASETKSGPINTTSMIENCETSAVGRALGFAGFGIDKAIASADEMNKVDEQQKAMDNELMNIEQTLIVSELSPELKEQLRNFYGKDPLKLTFKEAEVSINSLMKKGLIKSKQEQNYEIKEREEIF